MKINRKILVGVFSVFLFFNLANSVLAAPSWWPIVPCGTSVNPAPCNQCDLFKLAKNIIDFVLVGLMPPVAAILFVWAGFLILMAGANRGWVDQGKKIFESTAWGIVILSSSWLITNTIIKNVANEKITNPNVPWYQFECRVTTVMGGAPTTSTAPTTTGCNQNFGLSASNGCSSLSSCIDASSLTPSHDCASNNGTCLLSSDALARAQQFISTFNQLAAGTGCILRISSTIQVNSQPSISQCHHPNNAKSGTCADFNLIPDHDSCYQKFYQAAKDSGAVVSFLDEYTCPTSSAKGGNIHTNF